MEINNGEEELSVSETVFTNNSGSTENDNQELSEHGAAAAVIFHEFANGAEDADAAEHEALHIDGASATADDVHSLLAQREKDLVLAAELGKALLEENEVLVLKQEQTTKEHADLLEAMEQEKYELRRRLEITEGKYENKIVDLQVELRAVRKELTNQMTTSRLADKDKQERMTELLEQNHRLHMQLTQASETKDTLSSKLQHLQKIQPSTGRRKSSTSLNDQRALDDLQDEIRLLTSKSRELERRVYSLSEERDALLCRLKESGDRVLMLEKHSIELQQHLEAQKGELVKVRRMHTSAIEELEELRFQATLTAANHNNNNSLFFELEESQMQLSGGFDTLSSRSFSMDYEEGGDEKQDGEENLAITEVDDVFDEEVHPLMKEHGSHGNTFKENKYRKVLEEVYLVLSDILWELRAFSKKPPSSMHGSSKHRRRSSPGLGCSQKGRRQLDESPRPSSRSDEVRIQLEEVKALLQGILKSPQTRPSSVDSVRRRLSLDDHTQIYSLENHIETLREELCGTQTHIELLQAELDNQDKQMRTKDEQLSKLRSKASSSYKGHVQRQLQSLQDEIAADNEREGLTEYKEEPRSQIARVEPVRQEAILIRPLAANAGHELPRDEHIKSLQKERDDAIAKRNSAETELTQARLDMMNLDGQLLDAINQKLELSQELDQWQVDIHELLDDRLKEKLKKQELERRKARMSLGPASSQKSNKTKLAVLQKKFPFLNL